MNKNIPTHQKENTQAYVSWASESNREESLAAYGSALIKASDNIIHAQNRDFSNLTNYADGKPGLNSKDFDWFRPGQAAPRTDKEAIAFGRYVYKRVGIIRNSMDLMGDFCAQGVRLVHPNKRIERFYREWFKQVEGERVSERLGHLLFREANVPLRWYTAKINKAKRLEMQKSIAADISINKNSQTFQKGEIPWRYSFIDPLLVSPIGGSMSTLTNETLLKLKIPTKLRNEIRRLVNMSNKNDAEGVAASRLLSQMSPDILEAVKRNKEVILPPEKSNIYYYKKDDWDCWATPISCSAFEALNLYQRLQLADKAALDGAMNKIRVWKIGSLEHKLAPTEIASSTLSDMLGANVGGGTIDIVWGPDIELLETSSDIQSYLGEAKYKPALTDIYSTLGIPSSLTGSASGGTTNNYISLKTLVERLNYVRAIVVKHWEEQIEIVQKAMGFRKPAQVEFDIMHLEDPAAMTTLLLNMADRNIVSDEFVQRHVKADPDMEKNRLSKESQDRNNKGREKVSPYHQVDQDYGLKKIALQTGQSAPSEVGLELEEKKEGEDSLVNLKEPKGNPSQQESPVQEPGRPKNVKDTQKRQEKTFTPKIKASFGSDMIWAEEAQAKISDIINPLMLASLGKKSLRNLTSEEFDGLEDVKFEILCNLNIGDEITSEIISEVVKVPVENIHAEFNLWLDNSREEFDSESLSVSEMRKMRTYYYITKKYEA